MPDYHIFGGVLRSVLEFPELAEAASGTPTWWLTKRDEAPSRAGLELLGTAEVTPAASVSLSQAADGLQVAFDDTGLFAVSADGCHITWTPPRQPDMDAVRRDILGRVFAVSLHQQGVVTLHGSAVDLDGQAIAFLAPKYHGKSTTAAALVDSGATLLADDIVAVTTDGSPRVLPSVPTILLWQDSAARVAQEAVPLREDDGVRKLQVRWRENHRTPARTTPLAAIYLLAPLPPDGPQEARREELPAVLATVALLGQTKIGSMLGVKGRARVLHQLGDVTAHAPVFRLQIPRDFGRLEELTGTIWSWHQPDRPRRPTREPSRHGE